MISQNKTKNKI